MTISEFEQEFMGHVPEIMGAKAHYAVLVPLVEWRGEVQVLFEVRADTLERQPGEVCFPGGHMEPGESPTECAFRETWEELGIPASAIRPIARLDDVYMPRGDLMHPVMAQVETGAVVHMTASADEVKETFLVPADFFRRVHISPGAQGGGGLSLCPYRLSAGLPLAGRQGGGPHLDL